MVEDGQGGLTRCNMGSKWSSWLVRHTCTCMVLSKIMGSIQIIFFSLFLRRSESRAPV